MPKFEVVCRTCSRFTVYMQRARGNFPLSRLICGHCKSSDINLMKYYQTELQEIQELQDKIEKLKERVEMVGEGKIDLDDADREDELEMHPRH